MIKKTRMKEFCHDKLLDGWSTMLAHNELRNLKHFHKLYSIRYKVRKALIHYTKL